ncbi:hypothetical protein EWM64_g3898 [Hericium alpestre]|uniref:Uncharacterized protein n=1 Tax=Hericium alpestre TaxID=135208 RepID=A0A4Z0A0X3_9AGAM|nr:hypothetical protein EWM64_g3898 [Hericium alpestre]
MMLDPAILSVAFIGKRTLHYWSKASLFANPILRYILLSTGNISVDRKTNDHQALFREGTSYTEPHIMQVKDGASYAALEYIKWAQAHPERASKQPLVIVPTAIVYTNKSKYRSYVIMEFGRPISLDPYVEQYFSGEEGASRAAAKRLTCAIETQLVEMTINAPDWDTLYAARMARDLLWQDEKTINRDDFVHISQT